MPCEGKPDGNHSMTTPCPFCGVASKVPHETQEACIAALHDEIARMREMVRRVKAFPAEPSPPEPDSPDPADPPA